MAQIDAVFKWVLMSSAQASVLICLVLLAQVLLKDRIHAKWRWALWLLVASRLCLPWAPESPMSIFNLARLPRRPAEIWAPVAHKAVLIKPAAIAVADGGPTIVTPAKPASVSPKTDIRGLPGIAWLIGVLTLFAVAAVQALLFALRISREPRVVDRRAAQIFDDCRRTMGVCASPAVIETRLVKSPALFGLLRAKLLLPSGTLERLTSDQLRFVFLHELAHLKRHDVALNLFISALQFLHWFNPLVWYAFYRMRSDRELACDALALSYARPGEEAGYGKTLITLVEGLTRAPGLSMTVGIVESGSQLKRRISMIAKFRPGMYKWSLPALAVCLALVAVSLTNAQTPALPQVTRHEKPVQSPFPPPPTPPQPAGDLRLPSSYLSADLYEKLRKSYSKIAFTSEPFSSAVEAIRKATGVDIQIDRNKYPPEGKTVSLKPLDAPLSTVIDLLCRQVERKWAACHDTIFISDDEGLRKWLDENDIDADTVQVRKKLQKRLPYFEFSGQPFFAMIEVLRSTTQLNLVLDPNVPVQDKTITLQLTDASVETILKLLTVQVGVNWGIVKNFIYISDDEGIRKLFSQGPKGFESDAEALEVEKKLQNRIPYVEFAGQPFMTVIALVGSKAGLNIVVDPGPAPTPDRVITVTIENATVKSIIDLVTAQVGLNWTITENFVYISDDEGIRNLLSRQPRSKAQVSDIWITPEDITLIEGDYCRFISAAIHTKGSGVIPNVQVRFYLGDPDKGGKLIGEGGLSIEAGKTAREAIPWDAAPGRHEIYAIVDPDNNITETDETNNRASAMVTIEAPFKLKEKAGAETK